jgi:transposase-like protein/very-short-patch-repair endonuclease
MSNSEKELTIYSYIENGLVKDYFVGSQLINLLGYKNTTQVLGKISIENKINFRDFKGNKEIYQDPRTILITKEGINELFSNKIRKKIDDETKKIFTKYNILDEAETSGDISKTELTTYTYISNGLFFEYFVGYEISSLLGYKNVNQAISNSVSKCNQLLFKDYPGAKFPPLEALTILISRDGVCDLLLKTRKRISEDVLYLLKEFNIDTTNKKCLTKEQQTLSAITNAFKTEKYEDQLKINDFYLDLYFPNYKIVVECDENGHQDRKPCDERIRMDYVNLELGITDDNWIRYNPDEHDFDISKVIGKIYVKMEQFKLKEKEKLIEEEKNKFLRRLQRKDEEDVEDFKLEIEPVSGKFRTPPKDVLVKLLQKYNISDLASKFGISTNPVSKWLKEYGLSIHDFHNINPPPVEELKKLCYKRTQTEVAKYYNTSPYIVRKWLSDYNLKMVDLRQKDPSKDELLKLLAECKDKEEIAEKLDTTVLNVEKFIQLHDMKKIPSKEELENNLHIKSKDDLARFYNTTRTTLRKWIKAYNLEHIRYTLLTHRPIVVYNEENICKNYDSIVDACQELKMTHITIKKYLDTDDRYKGYLFSSVNKNV